MYKEMLLITSILILSGCAGKKDFTQGVSEEDKKLISSYNDELLYKNAGIRITKNGFYPDCNININETVLENQCFYRSIYLTRVSNFSKVEKFNLKKFMKVINRRNLKKERINRIIVQQKYPLFEISKFNSKDIDILSSKTSSLHEKQKVFVRNKPKYISQIINPNEELQKIAILADIHALKYIKKPTERIWSLIKSKCEKHHNAYWKGKKEGCYYPPTPSPKRYSESNSGGGSYVGSGHYKIQTVYVPGGNGRTTQTSVWVND